MWHAAPAPPHAPFLLAVPNARTMRDIDKLPVDISLCIIKSLKRKQNGNKTDIKTRYFCIHCVNYLMNIKFDISYISKGCGGI